MSIKQINTQNAPAAIGPYTQGYIAGDFLFISGQGGLNPTDGSVVEGGIQVQAEQAIQNIKAILEKSGTDLSKVVKVNCYLTDMNDFVAFNAVYANYFISKPARTCIAVRQLPLGVLCEIEAVVYIK